MAIESYNVSRDNRRVGLASDDLELQRFAQSKKQHEIPNLDKRQATEHDWVEQIRPWIADAKFSSSSPALSLLESRRGNPATSRPALMASRSSAFSCDR
jgi:hypothetical protein